MSRKRFEGKVVSDKMQKTVVVLVERHVAHPLYKKIVRKTSKFLADTNNFDLKVGDTVVIEETRPISRRKHFVVIKKLEK
jgi:small subunit ribosomal protein S17